MPQRAFSRSLVKPVNCGPYNGKTVNTLCRTFLRSRQWASPVILATRQGLSCGCLWVHFIANVASQAAMINGSSSVLSGDTIAGITWERIAKQRILPCFDRVETGCHEDGWKVLGGRRCRVAYLQSLHTT